MGWGGRKTGRLADRASYYQMAMSSQPHLSLVDERLEYPCLGRGHFPERPHLPPLLLLPFFALYRLRRLWLRSLVTISPYSISNPTKQKFQTRTNKKWRILSTHPSAAHPCLGLLQPCHASLFLPIRSPRHALRVHRHVLSHVLALANAISSFMPSYSLWRPFL